MAAGPDRKPRNAPRNGGEARRAAARPGSVPLPARPGGPRDYGEDEPKKRRPGLVRAAELVLLAALAAFIFLCGKHYLDKGRLLDVTSGGGQEYLRSSLRLGGRNLKESYGLIKAELPQTASELQAWLKARGREMPDTDILIAQAAAVFEPTGAPDSETATDRAIARGEKPTVSAQAEKEFQRKLARIAREIETERRTKRRNELDAEVAHLSTVQAPAEKKEPPPSGGPTEPGAAAPQPGAEAQTPVAAVEPPAPRQEPAAVAEHPSEPKEAPAAPAVAAETVRNEEPAVEAKPTGPAAPGASDADLEAGRRLYVQAMSHFRNTGGQNPDSQKELAASRELFRKAQENLQRAYDRNPSNREIEELLTRNNMFLYDCMKRTTLK